MPLHLVTYGIDKSTNELRNIDDVQSGLDCNCVCPKCGSALEAHKGKVYRHHFQHHSVIECKGAFESQLHILSKAIIEEHKAIMLPDYNGVYCSFLHKQQSFSEVIQESIQGDLQPDCLCKYLDEHGNEQILWVEILYTHAVDDDKAQKIRDRQIACVEIDVSQLFKDAEIIDKDVLSDFLLNNHENRKWINHPFCDEQILKDANEIKQQGSIINFLIGTSNDVYRIQKFPIIVFSLFGNGYKLSSNDRNELLAFIKSENYSSLQSIIQWRYISAIQLLLCQKILLGKYAIGNNLSIVQQLQIVCSNRNVILQNLSQFVNDVARMDGYTNFTNTINIRRREPEYFLQRGKWIKRRRF